MGRISAGLREVDDQLYQLVKDFEILNYINPTNIETEKTKFLKSKGRYIPEFKYKLPNQDFAAIKRKLNRVPVEKIGNDKLEFLYEQTIQSFSDRIDIISNVGSAKFLEHNLRYFGEPQKKDVDNASFILYCPNAVSEERNNGVTHVEAKEVFKEMIDSYGFDAEVMVTKKIVSKAMVQNRKKRVLLKEGAYFNYDTLHGTAHHEIGVHMVTTMNSNYQPLKIFNVGLPLFTKTQEGLAIMAEYLSGHLSIWRIKELALRVMGIHRMINGDSFPKVYAYLLEEAQLKEKEAFYMTTRIFRGGGCTKDHLYLKGFAELKQFRKAGNKFNDLLIGKTSLNYLPIIKYMIDEGYASKAKYKTKVFKKPRKISNITEFIINGLK